MYDGACNWLAAELPVCSREFIIEVGKQIYVSSKTHPNFARILLQFGRNRETLSLTTELFAKLQLTRLLTMRDALGR